MDFFEHQDAAQRKTSILIFYYCLAVVAIIVAVYMAVSFVFGGGWDAERFVMVSLITIVIVGLGSILKSAQLKQGGQAVAEMLGGRPVDPASIHVGEKRLMNVVQEMAIASGTPVPPVYILENEQGINAFAAGFNPGDAVIGVTRGCVDLLGRDELQGVIAHEFSHILNGDMRLNIRLIGVLAGILAIALIGFALMRTAAFSSFGYHRPRRKEAGGAGMALLALGIALIAIGYIGVFFAKVIKGAVSRQREYLADAAAVQFTRSPSGLASALKKIGGLAKGSQVLSDKAEEASHLFFANGVTNFLSSVMSTHPPLGERIRRLEPSFDDGFEVHEQPGSSPASPASFAINPQEMLESVGTPRPEHVAYASELLARVPDSLLRAAHEPFGARALIYNLLLDRDTQVRSRQLMHLREKADPAVYAETLRLEPLVARSGPELRLPVSEIAFPALRSLSPTQYRNFRECVQHLVEADSRISLFEYTLQHMLLRHLEQAFSKQGAAGRQVRSLSALRPACIDLLSTLAHVGHETTSAAQSAFDAAVQELFPGHSLEMGDPSLSAVDRALDNLAAATPKLKRKVVAACAVCMVSDGKITVGEAELLRAVADSLACPIPPMLASSTTLI